MTPAVKTPAPIMGIAFFMRMSKMDATKAPVHAPVPGKRTATSKKSPKFLYLFTFSPLRWALISNLSITGAVFSYVLSQEKILRKNNKIKGTGIIFPMKDANNASQ